MLEFSVWYFALLANFLILLAVLNFILFKPMVKLFHQREDTIKGALDSAKKMNEEKENGLLQVKLDLENARLKARDAFEQIRGEGLEKQRQILTRANQDALAHSEKVRAELTAETAKAREAMKGQIDEFADSILRKLVKA